ncbi:ureidoglycolate lyase [Falsirhodobacter sp. alg1]|uniref:ureidoglycolate lyase n=1 Tax=Falsirhodobacter sp. alg1 TaxID=1472418 RepID=UPI0005F0961A|nr:ureidoglycolate lyase [Falsirhodobacter sp. alg1]
MEIRTQPLTSTAFAPFGDVLEASGPADMMINQGMCERFHDRAHCVAEGGRLGISIFRAVPRNLPYRLEMMERHPHGSQAFMPMSEHPFLVIVAPDDGGRPGVPLAFLSAPHQGVNLHRGTWHGVLTSLHPPGLFMVVDRIGTTPNLEEHWLETPITVI